MKLEEIKKFVAELRGLSQEELAKKKTNLRKNFSTFVSKAAAGQLDQTARLNEVKNKLHVLKLCNLKLNNRLGKEQF